MKKHWLLFSVTGVLFCLVLLVATAPAAWLAWGVARATANQVLLATPRGSVWQGQATLILQGQHVPPQSLGGFSWRINPFWLVTGHVPIAVRGTDPAHRLQADIKLSHDTLVLQDVDVRLPAGVISVAYPPALFFNFGGELRLTTPAIELKRGAVTGLAELYWQAATTSLSRVKPLGDYRLYLNGEAARATFKLETPRGALLLVGDGQWDLASGRLDFNGLARPLGHAAELEPLLQVFGRNQGGGQRSFVASTRVLLAL